MCSDEGEGEQEKEKEVIRYGMKLLLGVCLCRERYFNINLWTSYYVE
jgi:hypothetical protein